MENKKKNRRGGNAIVEMAVVFPLFTAVVLMVFDIGHIWLSQVGLEMKAHQEVRRLAKTTRADIFQIEEAVLSRLGGGGSSLQVKIHIEGIPADFFQAEPHAVKKSELIELILKKKPSTLFHRFSAPLEAKAVAHRVLLGEGE